MLDERLRGLKMTCTVMTYTILAPLITIEVSWPFVYHCYVYVIGPDYIVRFESSNRTHWGIYI